MNVRLPRQVFGKRSNSHRRPQPSRKVSPPLIEHLEDRQLLSTIYWNSATSGAWNNATNWSPQQVPNSTDNVIIDESGATPTITISSGNQSVLSITASDPLSITSGSLTVAADSTISGGLSMTGGSLVANGSGASLTVSGTTTVSGANLYAEGGATLTLQDLTGYANPGGGATHFQATGAGSTLSLPSLASLGTVDNFFFVQALQGGQTDLPALAAITTSSPYVQVESDGSGSTVNLPALTSFAGSSGLAALTVTDGGTVLTGDLTAPAGVDVTLDGTGTLATSQWTSLTSGGALTIIGGAYTFDLTDFDGSSAYVDAGGSLTLPDVTGYANPGGGATHFQATGTGSTLSLPSLASLGTVDNFFFVQALQGGQTDLPALAAITTSSPYVQVESDGSGSTVDLPALTSFAGSSGLAALTVTDGGTVLTGDLTAPAGVDVTLDGTGTLATSQWTSLTSGGALTITGGAYTFDLTDFDGSSAYVDAGGSLTLPDVTGYANPGGGATHFQATGAGSTLSLPALASLGTVDNFFFVQALQGGQTDLPALAAITTSSPYVQVESDGSGSTVNLPALTSFAGSSGLAALTVTDGGTVLTGDLTAPAGVDVTLDGTGTLATSQWTSLTSGGALTITGGAYTFDLTDFDGSSAYVDAGDSLTLPDVTGYANPGGGATHFQATGAGSTLSLPALASLGTVDNFFFVQALQGGQTDLPALAAITTSSPYVQVESDGSGSTVNLPALTSFAGSSGLAALTVTDGGTVLDPNLTTFSNVTITTDPTATLTVPASQTFTFPSGTTTVNTGTLLDQGNMSVQGKATLNIQGDLTINGEGALSVSSNATLDVSGNLLGNTTNAAGFSLLGTVVLDSGNGTSNPPQQLEAMSQDLGNVAAGFIQNFAYNTLSLTANTYVELVDDSPNSPGGTPEAVYVNTLNVPAGATLNLNGLHLYANTDNIKGTITGGVISPTTVEWISETSGDWNVASNWSTGIVPGSNDDVIIDVPGVSPTVTISSGDQSVLSVTASDPLSITGGSLTVAADSSIAGGFSMTGGALDRGWVGDLTHSHGNDGRLRREPDRARWSDSELAATHQLYLYR